MKKIIPMLLLLCLLFQIDVIKAAEGTTYTYTISVDGEWIRTQDAYLPSQVYLKGAGLNKPMDLFVKEDIIYIADSGNGRIVSYNYKDGSMKTFGEGILKGPRGVFVSEDDVVYVADYDKEAVCIFSPSGELIKEIGRPDSYLFSEQSRYKPVNVVATSGGVIYVVGEGSYEGIMQFSPSGEFQGYFAANKAGISMLQRIQEMIFTEEQMDRLFTRTPRAIMNMDITDRDLLYSVTQDAGVSYAWREAEISGENNVKLHNLSGVDILSTNSIVQEWNYVDIAAGNHGNSYALTFTGLINEYDREGNLVFSFGGRAVSSERSGLFTNAAAIDVDKEGFLYVLDSERGLIQVFYPTEFAAVTHKGIQELEQGNYKDSEEVWKSLLKLNGMSRLAHNGYGQTLFYQQRFSEAMEHFRLANNRGLYSESFWEIRDQWINRYIGIGIVILLILLPAISIVKKVGKKKGFIKEKEKKVYKSKLVRDLLYITNMLRHPIDSFYYLKKGEKGSILSATIIYITAFLIFLFDTLFRGFVFNFSDAKNTSLFSVMALFFVPCFLWLMGNYMVSSINEGEGKLRSIYIGTAYSLAPYVIFTPFVIVLTYVLTLNEAFMITFSWQFFVMWSALILFLGVMEIHNYTVKESIKNILITLFFIIMVIVAFVVLYIIWDQIIEFFKTIGGEVIYRGSY